MSGDLYEIYDDETQFVHECMTELGFDTNSWAKLSGSEQADLLAHMKYKRQFVVIREPV